MLIDCEGDRGPLLTAVAFLGMLPGVDNLGIWATMPDQVTCRMRARVRCGQGMERPRGAGWLLAEPGLCIPQTARGGLGCRPARIGDRE